MSSRRGLISLRSLAFSKEIGTAKVVKTAVCISVRPTCLTGAAGLVPISTIASLARRGSIGLSQGRGPGPSNAGCVNSQAGVTSRNLTSGRGSATIRRRRTAAF